MNSFARKESDCVLIKVSAGVADILCITQITLVITNNALLANYRWFGLTHLEVFRNFATLEHRLKSEIDFVG